MCSSQLIVWNQAGSEVAKNVKEEPRAALQIYTVYLYLDIAIYYR